MKDRSADNNSQNQDVNTEEFLHLLRLNQKRIFAFILGLLHHHANAEDVMQETITVMWRKFSNYKADTDFTAWGITIAKFACYNYRRKNHLKHLLLGDELLELLQSDYLNSVNKLDYSVEALRGCVSKLDDSSRDMVNLRYEKDMNVSEVAKFHNRTVQSIYRKIARIHIMLVRYIRRTLTQEGIL